MDEARFDNPKVINSGSAGFANSIRTMPSDVVSKSMPPSILDRFRAMVKEREDEVRVSEDEVVSLSTDEVVRLYELVLSELTFNSKPVITDLTIIAGEQREHGQGIAYAICTRILEVQVEQKLPSLYLLDSIVKNIGKEYVTHFAARLPEVFCEAYMQVHSNMYPAMRHLFGTWSTVFPSSVLRKIETRLQFSPPLNSQSSNLTSLRASESPRPTHGIHVNPKYLEARRQFSHSASDAVGAERLSSSSHGHTTTARIGRSSASYQVKHGRSLSPSIDDLVVDGSPRRGAQEASPSHSEFDHGFSRVSGRLEQTNDWQKTVVPDDIGRRFEASAAYKYNNGVNLDRPRALIDAYGIDEREKMSNHKHLKVDCLNVNGIHKNVTLKTWQNTEEEEFNWEDMSPALVDSGRSTDLSIPQPTNFRSRPGSGTRRGALLPATNFRGNMSKQVQLSVFNDPYASEDVSAISQSGPGVIDRIAGFNNEKNQLPGSNFVQEGFSLPRSLPQSQHPFSVKGVGRSHQIPFSVPLAEQKPPLIGSFQSADGQNRGSSSLVSKIGSSGFDPLLPEMQPAGPASTVARTSASMPSSYRPPSLPSPQPHDKIGYQPATVTHQGPNKSTFPLQQLDATDSKPQINMPQFSTQKHGLISQNQQFPRQVNILQQPLRLLQEAQQTMVPHSVSVPSHLVRPSLSHGYIPPQGHVAPIGTVGLNNIHSSHSSIPIANAPFQLPGALPPIGRAPSPVSSQILPISQNQGSIGPNAPPGGALSLINTLMAQGVISLTNQAPPVQDAVGLEFNQDLLKVRHESAITALYADLPRQCTTCGLRFKCQEAHSSHMDWHVTKNRISKNRKQKPSRKWFVNLNMWLSSAEALGNDAVPGFLPTENTVENTNEEEMAVPADDDQKACALCGEPFDDFYSDETEEWMYKGAVYMNAPSGLTAGMDRSQLGPIVHAKCRSETSGVSPEDHRRNEVGYTEEGRERKRLRS